MKHLFILACLIFLSVGSLHAQNYKDYGVTETIRVHQTSSETLMELVNEWIHVNLSRRDFRFYPAQGEEGIIAGQGKFSGDFGSATYDLTFYVKNNVVDVVLDNVYHSKDGRLNKEERSKGTAKAKVKEHIVALADDLRFYLQNPEGEKVTAQRN